MTTINYDKPVKDLIDELNATGHVSHRSYKKKSVTVHHNAGRLSHEGVLAVWKVRPASAHFDVDKYGAVAQYVKVNEYAWAQGHTVGNQESISIEQANSTLGPNWEVSETTWKSSARLTGWLFAKVIGTRPDKSNVHQHKYWRSTVCAGPHMDKVWNQFIQDAQAAYEQFTSSKPKPNPNPGPQPGPNTGPKPTPPSKKSNETIAAEVWAGKWGNGDERIRRLTASGYNAKAIQTLVDQGVGKPSSSAKPSGGKTTTQVAREVLRGMWGNGTDRRKRLRDAGYDYEDVQKEVNRLLG